LLCQLDFVEECYCTALFPWSEQSLGTLWYGEKNTELQKGPWKQMISDWSGALAIGTLDSLLVIPLGASGSRKGLSVSVPKQEHNVRGVIYVPTRSNSCVDTWKKDICDGRGVGAAF
jgi:polycomb protein EED